MTDEVEAQTLIFILGMGRSGTSALAKTFALCGGRLPDDLLGPHESNAKGHFEPLEALRINLEFLGAFASEWDDPTFRVQHDIDAAAAGPPFVTRISEFLASYVGKSPLVVKEPRITMLTPYWFAAADSTGWDVKVAVPVRHPNEVRDSLAHRQNMPAVLSDALWSKYNLMAERHTRDYPRVFISHHQLFCDPQAQMERAFRQLHLELRYDAEAVDEFLDGNLRHHDAAGSAVQDDIAAAVFAQLQELCSDRPADLQTLDGLYERSVEQAASG